MLTFKKILVPFDGSEHAKRALAKAVSLAQCCDGAKLYIITVDEDVSALSMNNLERAYINEQMQPIHFRPADKTLDEAKAAVPEGIEAEYIAKTGDPGMLIENTADQIGADLVVMGSRGLGALTGMLLGSVSNYLLTHVEAPVFISRKTKRQPLEGRCFLPPVQPIFSQVFLYFPHRKSDFSITKRKAVIMLDFKKILVPYDGSSHAKKALNQAISLAQCSDGAELYVATILNSTIPADDDPDQVDMAEVEKLIPENIPHKVLLEMGEPVPMLLYLAGEIGADLIITGSRGRGALKSLFMGSVSSGILKNAKCPVFIIK